MRSAALAVLLAALLPASAAAAGFPEPLPALRGAPSMTDRGGRIVDDRGREVMLRGVNVNALVHHWQGSPFPTAFPLTPGDVRLMRGAGWNAVRLLVSWSRIEPDAGVYDARYLETVRAYVRMLDAAGIYTIVDLHQDRYGPHVAARPGEVCPEGTRPALGWDGAPAWATLIPEDVARCSPGSSRASPAVSRAWRAFWGDAEGPGGVGIRSRYVAMLRHLSQSLAPVRGFAGIDVMNEPGAGRHQEAELDTFHSDAVRAIREGEAAAGTPPRLVLVEPAVPRWTNSGPPDAGSDPDLVYAPHLYAGGLSALPFDPRFLVRARDESYDLGGAPVVAGEWGTGPWRAGTGFFDAHLDRQDELALGSLLWVWRVSCGDPHNVSRMRAGGTKPVWGLFDVDCATNATLGVRPSLMRELTRPYVRAAPGRLARQRYSEEEGRFAASGTAPAGNRATLVVFHPAAKHPRSRISATGLGRISVTELPGGGRILRAVPRGRWRLSVAPPPRRRG